MENWKCVNIVSSKEEQENLNEYLERFPQFKELFVKRNFAEEVINKSLDEGIYEK